MPLFRESGHSLPFSAEAKNAHICSAYTFIMWCFNYGKGLGNYDVKSQWEFYFCVSTILCYISCFYVTQITADLITTPI
jgi:hypothetical protein